MTTWNGWEPSLLNKLGVDDSEGNRAFLTGWANDSGTHCRDNPIAARLPLGGSTDCHHIAGSAYVQSYTTRGRGIEATAKQLQEDRYKSVLGALQSGDPILYSDWQVVVGELGTWGAHKFATVYGKAAKAAQSAGGGGKVDTSDASRGLAGYKHFAHSLSHTVPKELRAAQKLRRAALAKLHHKA